MKRIILLIILLLFTLPAMAKIYKWVDENGKTHFTDKPPFDVEVETVKLQKINTFEGIEVEPNTFASKKKPKNKR